MVFTRAPAAAARAGQADLALACDTEDLSGLWTLAILTEKPIALLSAQHPLAVARQVTPPSLRAEAAFAEDCPALSLDEIIDSVALNLLIVGEGAADRTGPAVTSVAVNGLGPSTLVLAWAGDPLPTTAAFLAAARRYAARTGTHALPSAAAS
jgi:DNA-binding transcriptional LysR family regulator